MKSVEHTKTFDMDCPVAELFPLFSPEGETRWVPNWSYENVTGTTALCEDYPALAPQGEAFISGFGAEAYDEFIGEWRTHLTNCFASRRQPATVV